MKYGLLAILLILPLCACSKTSILHNNSRLAELAADEVMGLGDERERLANLPVPVILQKGQQYLRTGNLPLARIHYLAALKKDPESPAACTGYGDVLLLEGNRERAEMAYQAALKNLPGYPPAILSLVRLRRNTGDVEGAIDLLSQARRAGGEDPELLSELAITLDESGLYDEADLLHRQVAEIHPSSASASSNLGFHYLIQERYSDAIPPLQKAVRLDPRNVMARNNLAVAYALNGETEKALPLFKETIGEAAAWNNIGYLYMTQEKRELAEKALRKALELNPKFYVAAKKNLELLNQRPISKSP